MRTTHVLMLGVVFLIAASAAALLFLSDGSDSALTGPFALDPGAQRPQSELELAGGARPASDGGRVAAEGMADADAQPASELPVLLTGRTVGPEGTPIEGASIFARNGSNWSRLPLELEGQEGDRGTERIHTESGSDGRFVVRAGLEAGELRFVARAAGFAARRIEGERLPERALLDLGDVRLERSVVLAGRVVDRAGDPVAGARILQAVERGVAGMLVTVHGKGIPLGATDAKGRFRLDQIPHGSWRLIVDAEGFLVREESGQTNAPGEVLDDLILVLERGDTIAGRVVDVPAALRGAALRVEARPVQDEEDEGLTPDVHRRARTALVGVDGAFEVDGVAGAGRFNLTLWTEEGGRFVRAPRAAGVEALAGARGVELTFRPETSFTVRVVDQDSGAPVSAYVLWAATGGRNRLSSLKQDDDSDETLRVHPDGRARYGDLRPPREGPMTLRLRVRAVGYAELTKQDIELERDTQNDLGTLALEPAPVVRVTVVTAVDGQPIEGARVYLAESGSESLEWYARRGTRTAWSSNDVRYAEANADGVARVPAPGPIACDVFAAADGFVPCAIEPIGLQPGGANELTLVLELGAAVTVRVRDTRGGPVAGVTVLARVETADGSRTERGRDSGWDLSTDEEGVARFEHLPPATYRFAVEPEAASDRWRGPDIPDEAWQRLALVHGDDATLELEAPARGLLRGRVTEAGQPLPGASLRLARAGQQGRGGGGDDPRYGALTMHDGLFAFEGVAQGEYELTIGHPDRTMGFRTEVTVGTREELIELNLPLSIIEGRVTERSGAPLAGAEVRVEYMNRRRSSGWSGWSVSMVEDDEGRLRTDWNQGAATRARTGPDGAYRLRGLAVDGTLRVSVRGEFVTSASTEEVQLAPDEIRRNVDFVLDRAGRIEVRLAGRPENGYRALAEPAETLDAGNVSGTLYRSRRANLGPCLPGEWTVIMQRYEGRETVEVERHSVVVRAGETTRLELSLP